MAKCKIGLAPDGALPLFVSRSGTLLYRVGRQGTLLCKEINIGFVEIPEHTETPEHTN